MERWKTITGYPLYEVSDNGEIRNKETKKMLSTKKPDFLGYCRVCLKTDSGYKTEAVHRIVAKEFLDNPLQKVQVHHIDGDKTNNAARNLEWVTPKEHGEKDSKRRTGTKHHENWEARQKMSY